MSDVFGLMVLSKIHRVDDLIRTLTAERDAALAEAKRLREALERFPAMARSIAADLCTAHSLRGPGASGAMREDDQDLRRAFEAAIAAARAALAKEPTT